MSALEPWDARWQQNTCPECGRTFKVTPSDDVLVPGCGCYDNVEPHHYLCESCGLRHVFACLDKGPVPERRFTAIVDEHGTIVAQVEGKAAGDALADEFIVEGEQ